MQDFTSPEIEALMPAKNLPYRFFVGRMASLMNIAGFKNSGVRNIRTGAPVILKPGQRKVSSSDPCLGELAVSAFFASTKAANAETGKKPTPNRLSGVSGYFQAHRSRIAAQATAQPGARQLIEGHKTTFISMSPFDLFIEAITDDYEGPSVFVNFVKKTNLIPNIRMSSNGTRFCVSSADVAQCAVLDKRVLRRAFAALQNLESEKRRSLFFYARLDRHPLFNAAPTPSAAKHMQKIEAAFPDVRYHLRHLPRFDSVEFERLTGIFGRLAKNEAANQRSAA
jgi:hypothetical protein